MDCFAADYRNQNPLHPARDFEGSSQVRRNWEQILHLVPDIQTEVLASAVDGSTVWAEMEHRGTRLDGSPHLMRGTTTFTVVDGHIASARFYLEPVETGGADAREPSQPRSARRHDRDPRGRRHRPTGVGARPSTVPQWSGGPGADP